MMNWNEDRWQKDIEEKHYSKWLQEDEELVLYAKKQELSYCILTKLVPLDFCKFGNSAGINN